MKTLLLTLIITGTLFAATAETEKSPAVAAIASNANTGWVDAQIAAIKPPRKGISAKAVHRVKNPFKVAYKQKATTSKSSATATSKTATKKVIVKPLKLTAILNDSALIAGKWCKKDDKVKGYSVAKIAEDSVILKRGKAKRTLFLTATNPKIKIQIK
ncbi:MAG: hypothetical protein U9Q62_02235 [Campylobacterota bacterium]|nr:hypothetical protein [Campylobacterota bacterium]